MRAVRSLHVQDRPAATSHSGDRCALALTSDFEEGHRARHGGSSIRRWRLPLRRFHGELRVPARQGGDEALAGVHVHLGTDITWVGWRCSIAPGPGARPSSRSSGATMALRGDRFVLRDAGASAAWQAAACSTSSPTRHKRNTAAWHCW